MGRREGRLGGETDIDEEDMEEEDLSAEGERVRRSRKGLRE